MSDTLPPPCHGTELYPRHARLVCKYCSRRIAGCWCKNDQHAATSTPVEYADAELAREHDHECSREEDDEGP